VAERKITVFSPQPLAFRAGGPFAHAPSPFVFRRFMCSDDAPYRLQQLDFSDRKRLLSVGYPTLTELLSQSEVILELLNDVVALTGGFFELPAVSCGSQSLVPRIENSSDI
jgi:hypothetical protein